MTTQTTERAARAITRAACDLYRVLATVERDAARALNTMREGGRVDVGLGVAKGPIAGQDALGVASASAAVNQALEFAFMLNLEPEDIDRAYQAGVAEAVAR
jgi:hypothetical protein